MSVVSKLSFFSRGNTRRPARQGQVNLYFDKGSGRFRANAFDGSEVQFSSAPSAGTPVHAVAAAVTINPTGDDNNITYTADDVGSAGNSITIQYVISGSGVDVSVTGKDILVTAASGTLASAVISAVNGHAGASALVTAVASGTVSGAIDDVAKTPLTGGVDATVAKAGTILQDGSNIYIATTDIEIDSTTGWKKAALSNL